MKFRSFLVAAATALTASLSSAPAFSDEPFIGELRLFGNNFCPRGWSDASGQLLPISQNDALFSLLGTIYGGDGRTTFALPDFRYVSPVGEGTGPGLSTYVIGQKYAGHITTLTVTDMPSHSHTVNGTNLDNNSNVAAGDVFGKGGNPFYTNTLTGGGTFNSAAVTSTGGSQSFSVQQPALQMMWCIALTGIYPSRN